MVGKSDPELGAHCAHMLHHAVYIIRAKEFGQGPTFRRRFRMDLNTTPFDNKVELLLQLFDDTLADVAERSDIVGKDLNRDGHGMNLVYSHITAKTLRAQRDS